MTQNVRARSGRAALLLAALSPLTACGGLPRPFQENPGTDALALSAPPPTRLAVPTPVKALLPAPAAASFAEALAASLDDQEVPAEALAPVKGDWRLVATASRSGPDIVPHFQVLTPTGVVKGETDGTPIDAAAWQTGDAAVMHRVASAAAPGIADLLTGIRAAQRQADPNSLMHRPARVLFTGIGGAPGDGDKALTSSMEAALPQQGDVLVPPGTTKPDYTVTGTVAVSRPVDGRQTVEIDWHVLDSAGHEAGKVSQLNAVPARSLDGAWGEIAIAAATEAASGIHQVIANNSGRNDKPIPPPKPGS